MSWLKGEESIDRCEVREACLLQMKTITDTRETEIKASRIQ